MREFDFKKAGWHEITDYKKFSTACGIRENPLMTCNLEGKLEDVAIKKPILSYSGMVNKLYVIARSNKTKGNI